MKMLGIEQLTSKKNSTIFEGYDSCFIPLSLNNKPLESSKRKNVLFVSLQKIFLLLDTQISKVLES